MNFIPLIVVLAIMAAMLGVLLAMLTNAAGGADLPTRSYLARLAWACLGILAATLILLVWVLIRYVAYRLQPRDRRSPTAYVNAWELAGKRFKLEKDEEEDQDEEGGRGPE